MGRYGYATEGTGVNDDDYIDERDYIGGVITMTEYVRDLQRARNRTIPYNIEVQHECMYTGVDIKFMSDKAFMTGSSVVCAGNAFAKAEEVIMEEVDNSVESSGNGNGGNIFVDKTEGEDVRRQNDTVTTRSQETTCSVGTEVNDNCCYNRINDSYGDFPIYVDGARHTRSRSGPLSVREGDLSANRMGRKIDR